MYLKTQPYHSRAFTQTTLQPTTEHLLNYVYISIMHNSRKLKTT